MNSLRWPERNSLKFKQKIEVLMFGVALNFVLACAAQPIGLSKQRISREVARNSTFAAEQKNDLLHNWNIFFLNILDS